MASGRRANDPRGRTFVEAALSRGDKVAATARSTESLDELVAAHGDAVLPLERDVTDKAAVFESVKRATEHVGRLDVIVNNAGYAQMGAIEELTEQQLRDQLETSVFGAVWVIQAALPYLREQGAGHIIQMSSAAGLIAMPLGGVAAPADPPFRAPPACWCARQTVESTLTSQPIVPAASARACKGWSGNADPAARKELLALLVAAHRLTSTPCVTDGYYCDATGEHLRGSFTGSLSSRLSITPGRPGT
ncbi:short subunit dehydrogenase [Nonomuraea polychroma]|uniref:Short subunit dehydrogenase n=2 Tax=Nonomuraea polychroma TaxID=46176 RepID=A0A438M8F3_9ACTN|nr:short subunit dehydrogenase [Nonomuraea polychroma]